MGNDNLISAMLSAEDVAEILRHVQAIRAKLAFARTLTNQERRELAKLGEKSVGFDEKCAAYMASHPQFLPGYLKPEEIAKDRALRAQLLQIIPQTQALTGELDDTLMLVSSECWKADLGYYQSVKEAAKRELAGAEDIYNDLASRFPGAPARKNPEPPAS